MKLIEGEPVHLARALRKDTSWSLRVIAREISAIIQKDVSHEWVRQVCWDIPRKPKTTHAGQLKAWRDYNKKIRLDAIKMLGGACAQCGYDDWRVLEIDHIEGGGREHRKRVDHKMQYRNIRDGNTEGYQLLCANCHGIKSHLEREARYETTE